jgi:hypothetical protein
VSSQLFALLATGENDMRAAALELVAHGTRMGIVNPLIVSMGRYFVLWHVLTTVLCTVHDARDRIVS